MKMNNKYTKKDGQYFDEFEFEDDEYFDFDQEYQIPQDPPRMVKVRKKKKKSFIHKLFTNIILLLCIVIFVISAYQLYMIYYGYKEGDEANQEIQSMALITTDDPNAYWKTYVDFDKLCQVNEDVVAWIKFEQPSVINYAVLQGEENDTYLYTTITGEKSIFGSIFMDMRNESDFTSKNTILYGHNMKNGSMFGSLNRYKTYEHFQEYPYFYLYTPDGMAAKYQVVATDEVRYDSWHYDTKFDTDTYQAYLDNIIKGSLYHTETALTLEDNILTLSTCTASDTVRLVVQGIKVEEHEIEIPEEVIISREELEALNGEESDMEQSEEETQE